ncbi:hypothetical protein A1O3_05569 [Capronia epimyces CBS 606.96]|uniref:Inheritance of peroxisomes protein 1 n=1 Tax=Capronia epimyces CBS 606.96 TaxID=1182542 RepID=W9YRK2_9EURO|nr:uncharacterized protein A1O3_05569 [Capronia epimyces CBS 606.96]EXJ84894.1 hypothetical protein A1O3_05569 [Capronia epimyces CBS 606.96]
MASSPSYGDRPPLQSYRRSFTAPPRVLSLHERAGLNEADADFNILYSHPSARIIAFSPPTDSIPRNSKEPLPETDYPVDTVETLPWRSRTEMLAATGPIVIEKVRGSGHFLKSADQKVIHTIMRNSQCWCVDGESKFVLRIGKFRYYRIELPSETEADKEKVEELKAVLTKVLRFERTPCPFKRAFHVDLPDDAITPRRKGAWKRKQAPLSTTPNTDPLPLQRTKTTRTWSLQGQATPTPLQAYGRRGSDYGFSTSRGPSPRPQSDAGGYRSATPSSLASSEEASDTRHDEGSSEDGSHQDETSYKQRGSSVPPNLSQPLESPVIHTEPGPSGQQSETETERAELQGIANDPSLHAVAIPSIEAHREDAGPPAGDLCAEALEESVSEKADTKEDERGDEEESAPQQVSRLSTIEVLEPDLSLIDEANDASGDATAEPAQEQSFTKRADSDSAPTTSEAIEHFDSRPADHPQGQDLLMSQSEELGGLEILPGSPTPDDRVLSRVSSVDSFHTTNSLTQELLAEHAEGEDFEETPHTEQLDPFSTNIRQHRRELSELTVTASTVDEHSEQNVDLRSSTSDSREEASTPALGRSSASESSWPDVQTPSPANDGLRRRVKRSRSLSPLPPSPTLFSPSSPSRGGHFTAAILQKACDVALVKPMEAVVLLVHILARIASGATVHDLLSGDLFRRPEQHRRRSSFPDQVSSLQPDSEDEDDFGVPLRGRLPNVEVKSTTAAVKDDDVDSIFDLD